MRKLRQGMIKMTYPGSLCELFSPLHHSAPECSKKVPPKINCRRENIKNYQVFFKEAFKIFGKVERCMLQSSDITINPFEGISPY